MAETVPVRVLFIPMEGAPVHGTAYADSRWVGPQLRNWLADALQGIPPKDHASVMADRYGFRAVEIREDLRDIFHIGEALAIVEVSETLNGPYIEVVGITANHKVGAPL